MTKELSDDWMFDHDLSMAISFPKRITRPGGLQRRSMKCQSSNTPLAITLDVRCKVDAIAFLKREGFDMIPMLEVGAVIGVVTEGNITNVLSMLEDCGELAFFLIHTNMLNFTAYYLNGIWFLCHFTNFSMFQSFVVALVSSLRIQVGISRTFLAEKTHDRSSLDLPLRANP
jgi:hypothetical protein